MIKRLNKYLLTHYPLLWNTRVLWITGICLVIHLCFYLAGFADIQRGTIQHYYSVTSTGGFNLYVYSILCSLAVIIMWLVFFLRNNAFKTYYIIDRIFLTKQFILIFFICFISISFIHPYFLGITAKVRSITSEKELVEEANIANLAASFVPIWKGSYFKLNKCNANSRSTPSNFQENYNYFDTTLPGYYTSAHSDIRQALKEKDAFSYKNYCAEVINLEGYPGFIDSAKQRGIRNRWIDEKNQDSIRLIIDQYSGIARKYKIGHQINPATLASWVFADSFNNVTAVVRADIMDDDRYQEGNAYFDQYEMQRVFSLLEESYRNKQEKNERITILFVMLYIAMCMAVLLSCYRFFSKRVFLISIVGIIVWSILIPLFSFSNSGLGGLIFLLTLCILCLLISLFPAVTSKTVHGVLLNWHIFILPFALMVFFAIVENRYDANRYAYMSSVGQYDWALHDHTLQEKYPFGHWVSNHMELLFRLNLIFVFFYVILFFTRLARKWHIRAEE